MFSEYITLQGGYM